MNDPDRWRRSLEFWTRVLRDLAALPRKERRRMREEIRNAREMIARADARLR